MINTNGLRIAKEPEFAARLAAYQPGFEVYLQFDSLRDAVHQDLRGARLADIRLRALEHLNAHGHIDDARRDREKGAQRSRTRRDHRIRHAPAVRARRDHSSRSRPPGGSRTTIARAIA
jgi:hypothetical protein